MDIRPFYTDPTGQAAVQANPVHKAGWRSQGAMNGLMLSRPLMVDPEEWIARPELQGAEAKGVVPAGMPPLQVQEG